MERCVIIGGARIHNYEAVKQYLKPDDFNIFCDCGLDHMEPLGISPSLIIGDFDSHENPHMDTETIVLPHEKDDTDTVYAVREGLKRGFDEFLLIGVVGNRLDHTLGNLYILEKLYKLGKRGLIVDDYSEMELVGKETVTCPDTFPYFSLVNITGKAEGITIRNAFYDLTDGVINTEYQYGVSNEPLPGKTAEVSVGDGYLLMIRDRKES